jgi:Flp pilus assembly protein TadD
LTSSPQAYNLYLQVRFYRNDYFMRTQAESLRHGEQLAQDAIAKDPNFAEACALLSTPYFMEAANISENAAQNIALGEKAARRAVALKPNSADALIALGGALTEQGHNLEALKALRQAVAIAPTPRPPGICWDISITTQEC